MKRLIRIWHCAAASTFAAAAVTTNAQSYWAAHEPSGALDEPMGERTALGTEVSRRTAACFPSETRDLFSEMDQVASGPNGKLMPLNFDVDGNGKISDKERDAIRGRNTWLLWGGGNEAFWGWLQERGFGLVDFLILMDSRQRESRFRRAGLINQPGFMANKDSAKRILGLYLDLPGADGIALLKQPAYDIDERTGKLATRPLPPPRHRNELFKPGNRTLYDEVRSQFTRDGLASDGLDPDIYGYPSGIFGLRLMLNPDFFGEGKVATKARAYWNERVMSGQYGDYYKDARINADPKLIRPFRVSMACGFCHVAPHPLNPPQDPENPGWSNLSSIIGNQYWDPQPAFGNLLTRDNFLYHFLNSQPPGTIDTSLVSTDHINNPNTINAIFDLPARLVRAKLNPPELQTAENLLMGSIEDGDASIKRRHFPRVLFDGADSSGALVALLRVPLNIGTFPEEWSRCHNPIIGFRPQRPFRAAVCQKNSVYWQANERYRIPYMAAFFTFTNRLGQSSTGPMKLKHAPTATIRDEDRAFARQGRQVFVRHCAICHSSKQPDDFKIEFVRDMPGGWENAAPGKSPGHYTLPMDFGHWEAFKRSPGYGAYVDGILKVAGPAPDDENDPFLKDNFLSTDVRIPVTLVGSNSGRAAATNAKRGQVWDNFSSEDYKNLPAVGLVRFYNPYSRQVPDAYGNNDSYFLEGNGPGYYRPASLISLWATAPYLHNNTLGVYKPDIHPGGALNPASVAARVAAFEDGVTKLLWNEKRSTAGPYRSAQPSIGDMRTGTNRSTAAARDPGYIYRIPQDTYIAFAAPFIRPLAEGVLGAFLTSLLTLWLPLAIVIVFALAAWKGGARHAGIVFLLIAAALAALLTLTGLGDWLRWLVVMVLVAVGFAFFFPRKDRPRWPRLAFLVLAVVTLLGTALANFFLSGRLGPLKVGPIPKGTPVSLLMNMDPEKKEHLPAALAAMLRAMNEIRKRDLKQEAAAHVFDREAGPALLRVSKCPDLVLDRGHWFGEHLSDEEKDQLIAFLKTL